MLLLRHDAAHQTEMYLCGILQMFVQRKSVTLNEKTNDIISNKIMARW